MSKGAKHTLPGFPFNLKSDGHKDIETSPINRPMVYCPIIKDITSSNYTSAGMRCSHCKKIY